MKELPARLRAYASYEHVKRLLQGYAKVGSLLFSQLKKQLCMWGLKEAFSAIYKCILKWFINI